MHLTYSTTFQVNTTEASPGSRIDVLVHLTIV